MQFVSNSFRVKYSETDQMGFMHHSNYLILFENARISWLRYLGLSYKKIEEDGIWMPVVESSLKHLKPSFFDDELTTEVKLKNLPKAFLLFNYKISNQLNQIVCTGSTKIAFLNSKTKRPVRCPHFLYSVFEEGFNK
tara:strand:+ start:17697 stop:18107 length:411 start_codon:yes stop_codon:yes gene_type:complete